MAKTTLKTHNEKRKAMMKRRLALKHTKDQNDGGGGGISNSHGVSWVRGRFLGQRGFGLVGESPLEMAVKSAYMDKASTLKTEKEFICTLRASPFVVKCYGDEITQTNDGKKVYNILLESGNCSLKDYIEKTKTGLPESEVKLYTRDILRGLQYVHCRGFVHCDINPSNILLVPGTGSSSRSGGFVAKITDFGLAKSMYSDEDETVKPRGAKSFTYMAPEVLAGYNPLESPADIWAVGCVVVEMMSGKQLWGVSEVDNDLLGRIAFSPELPEFPSNISEHGRDFLVQCLNKCHEDRWSAESLLGQPFLFEARW